jgi:hypothetical protein
VLLNTLYDDATSWPNGLDAGAQGAVHRAWPSEPAPWERQVEVQVEGQIEQPVHPPAAPETYAAREAYAAPEPQPDWPPAAASEWPHEESGDAESEPEPPPGWPNGADDGPNGADDEPTGHDQ